MIRGVQAENNDSDRGSVEAVMIVKVYYSISLSFCVDDSVVVIEMVDVCEGDKLVVR